MFTARTSSAVLSLATVLSLSAALSVAALSQAPAPSASTTAAASAQAGSPVEPGVLPARWSTGGPNCLELPAWQIHEYNPTFYILRESGCINYEKPFLYLIFGRDKALLEDTGAGTVETAPVIMDLMARWAARNKRTGPMPLVVLHSHSHGDHTAGDRGFKDLPPVQHVQFVAATVAELQKAFAIHTWPTDIVPIDLGGRVLDLIPIPGHDAAGIALYDRQTGILLTGDSVYPGRLYVTDAAFPAFVASHRRLVEFTADKPVAHVLGTHIEQTRTPFLDYPRGTQYQPDEHVLELNRGVLLEIDAALARLNGKPARVVLRDVILSPQPARP
jgi:glyoxylase-like metal-dependent hydrolase (beta-lactamase superfamily II)